VSGSGRKPASSRFYSPGEGRLDLSRLGQALAGAPAQEDALARTLLETVTFEEFEGKTKLTTKSVFQTVEDRNGMLESGMEQGS
jgi:hypothetical protein